MKMPALLFRPLPSLLLCVAVCSLSAAALHAQGPGDQDGSFATGPLANSSVNALTLQPNGQVLVGGRFSTFRGANRPGLARLNPDGSLDSLNPGLAITAYYYDSPIVDAVALQANGQIIIAGTFSVLGQTPGGGIARLNADGSLDSTFNVGAGGNGVCEVESVTVLANGQLLVGGSFTMFNGYNTGSLVRLNADGSVDTTFNPDGAGITSDSVTAVSAIVVQPDGRILVGGSFGGYNGASAGNIVRLHADGTLDTSFNTGTGATDDLGSKCIEAVALQPDGQILIGGSFTVFNGASVPHVVRLHADGSLDLTYDPVGEVTIADASAIFLQPNGAALVGGHVNTSGGQLGNPGNGLARINPNGTLDTSFNSEGNALDVIALAPQSDGRVLCAGNTFGGGLAGQTPGDVLRVYDISPTPSTFFTGQVYLGNSVYYLAFPTNGNIFGYYSYLVEPYYIYHFDLGYEYVFDAADGRSGIYLYDFKSNGFFYTSPTFPFPYLYDFTLNTVLYYYPDPENAGHYDTNGVRYFYDFATGKIISK